MRARGFTLLEMIAVIVVLGIVAALALPRLVDRSGFQSRGFAEAVRAALQHARAVAVASGCEVQVSVAGNDLSLNQRNGCTAGGFTIAVPDPVEAGAGYVVRAPAGMSLTSAPAAFVFDPLGQATVGGAPNDAQLTIGGAGAGVLRVFGSTGFVQ